MRPLRDTSKHLVPAHLQKLDDDGGKKENERQDGCDRKNLGVKHFSPHSAERSEKTPLSFAFPQCRRDRRDIFVAEEHMVFFPDVGGIASDDIADGVVRIDSLDKDRRYDLGIFSAAPGHGHGQTCLQREADEVSSKIDLINVTLEVDYEPKYDLDESFEDSYEKFIS